MPSNLWSLVLCMCAHARTFARLCAGTTPSNFIMNRFLAPLCCRTECNWFCFLANSASYEGAGAHVIVNIYALAELRNPLIGWSNNERALMCSQLIRSRNAARVGFIWRHTAKCHMSIACELRSWVCAQLCINPVSTLLLTNGMRLISSRNFFGGVRPIEIEKLMNLTSCIFSVDACRLRYRKAQNIFMYSKCASSNHYNILLL